MDNATKTKAKNNPLHRCTETGLHRAPYIIRIAGRLQVAVYATHTEKAIRDFMADYSEDVAYIIAGDTNPPRLSVECPNGMIQTCTLEGEVLYHDYPQVGRYRYEAAGVISVDGKPSRASASPEMAAAWVAVFSKLDSALGFNDSTLFHASITDRETGGRTDTRIQVRMPTA